LAKGGLVDGPIDREIRLAPGEYVIPPGMLDRYAEALKAAPELDRRRLRDGEWTVDPGGDS
jgi:hypothetical protein